jgi:hypothetical protein
MWLTQFSIEPTIKVRIEEVRMKKQVVQAELQSPYPPNSMARVSARVTSQRRAVTKYPTRLKNLARQQPKVWLLVPPAVEHPVVLLHPIEANILYTRLNYIHGR